MTLQLETCLNQLKETAEEILLLNLQEEGAVEKLELLQLQQQVLRDHIASVWTSALPGHLKRTVSGCLELEEQIKVKLESFQVEMNDSLKELKRAGFIRGKYQNTYIQAEGYFLDKHQ
ncbi:hypothetical protein KZ483_03575 [Paenibacillus sp. sptzw28]|uniref:hypothetical protein n=1 Tax=Paenibacillus sp. sptzw28 TaxID=715179 RepID=UPI001C6EB97F|nr:hypothetical protein [Paenibacillus sp. sptzw28]QYR22116.1 hypothetical protein KZ483_03575 [Paenibacillus sp. sptzw28]